MGLFRPWGRGVGAAPAGSRGGIVARVPKRVPLSPAIWTGKIEAALGAVHWASAVLHKKLSECNTLLDYFIELGCGFAIKQRSHLLTSFIVEGTAVHRLESGLIFKFNYSDVISSFERLQKLSAYEALEISEGLV